MGTEKGSDQVSDKKSDQESTYSNGDIKSCQIDLELKKNKEKKQKPAKKKKKCEKIVSAGSNEKSPLNCTNEEIDGVNTKQHEYDVEKVPLFNKAANITQEVPKHISKETNIPISNISNILSSQHEKAKVIEGK